jgi:hypothetical protein
MAATKLPFKRSEVIAKWASNYPEVVRWLAKLQEKETSAQNLSRFCVWAKMTPTELLALKDDPRSRQAEELLDTFVADENSGLSNSVKFNMLSAAKSFFKHNYRDLARACGAMTLDKVKPYNKPSKENLRKLWNWAVNPRDKALLTFVCSTAIAKETLTKLQWGHIEEGWEKIDLPCIVIPSKLLKGHGVGKYKGVMQITFLTPEAKRDLITYKEWMEQKLGRKFTVEDNIFLDTCRPYDPIAWTRLGDLIWRLSKASGIPFSLHDARRYVNTAMEEIRISPNWARKIRGRKVRGEESPYSQPAIQQLREKFREAVPLLEFTTEHKMTVPKEVADKLAELDRQQKELKAEYGIMYRKDVSEPKTKNKACAGGKHCGEEYKQVNAGELLQSLREGWTIMHDLPNGDVIVCRK